MGLSHLAIAFNTPGIKIVAVSESSRSLLRYI